MTAIQYAETAALLAVMENDEERLTEILEDMLPEELKRLYDQASTLLDRVYDRMPESPYRGRRRRG